MYQHQLDGHVLIAGEGKVQQNPKQKHILIQFYFQKQSFHHDLILMIKIVLKR